MRTEDLDKLDRLAAEKVMGWTANDRAIGENWYIDITGANAGLKWEPTRNITQAWELLERVGFMYHITKAHEGTCHVDIAVPDLHSQYKGNFPDATESSLTQFTVIAPTAPEAITRACLKAKGVEIE